LAQRRASARASRPRKLKSAPTKSAGAASSASPAPEPQQPPVDHGEHHELIARNLNGLLENFQELRTEMRVLGREVQALHKKFEQVEVDFSDVRKRIETVTSAVFDSDQTLRGMTKHVEKLWGTVAEIAGERKAFVEERKTGLEEAEKRRDAEMKRRLADLTSQSKTNN
jgi:chromosome segregation ATPase